MKSILTTIFQNVCLVLSIAVAPAALAQSATDTLPLPTQVFQNLAAGKKQTVITYGTSLTIKGAWAKATGEYFEKHYPGQVTFINAAKAGMTSEWGVENFKERVLSKKPDLVFLEFSINDAAVPKNVSLAQSKANLEKMLKELKAQNPDVSIVLQTMNLAWDSPRVAPKQYGTERPQLDAYYEIYRSAAREHKLPLVDNALAWQKILNNEPERYHKMVPDGAHPSSSSSLGITWPAVESLLEKTRLSTSR